jgi:low affinity Fe/Cu permease
MAATMHHVAKLRSRPVLLVLMLVLMLVLRLPVLFRSHAQLVR